jgi:hypothetical protein
MTAVQENKFFYLRQTKMVVWYTAQETMLSLNISVTVNTEDNDSLQYFPRIHFIFLFPSPPRNSK